MPCRFIRYSFLPPSSPWTALPGLFSSIYIRMLSSEGRQGGGTCWRRGSARGPLQVDASCQRFNVHITLSLLFCLTCHPAAYRFAAHTSRRFMFRLFSGLPAGNGICSQIYKVFTTCRRLFLKNWYRNDVQPYQRCMKGE